MHAQRLHGNNCNAVWLFRASEIMASSGAAASLVEATDMCAKTQQQGVFFVFYYKPKMQLIVVLLLLAIAAVMSESMSEVRCCAVARHAK